MKQRMFSYIRWSTPRQANGTSLKRQTAKAKAFAEKNNLEMVEIFDRGVSAFAGKNLLPTAALGSFIEAVKQGAIENTAWLYTENLDRLHRGKVTDAQELLLTLINLGITVVAGMDGEKIYTREYLNKNPHELFMTVMVFVRANEESETKRTRVLGNVEALYEDFIKGKKVVVKSVGNHPFWIDDTGPSHEGVKKHPVLWNVAREAIEMFLDGTSVWSVCNHLNAKYPNMYPSPKKIWTVPNVRKLRTNVAVLGTRIINIKDRDEHDNPDKVKTYTFTGYYPRLCTDDEWAIMNDVGKHNSYITNKKKPNTVNLLAGMKLIRCGHCGCTMNSMRQGDKIRYVCDGAQNVKTDCKVWSVSDVVEYCSVQVLLIAFSETAVKGRIAQDDYEKQLEIIQEKIAAETENISKLTQAITVTGNIDEVIALLQFHKANRDILQLEQAKVSSKRAVNSKTGDVTFDTISQFLDETPYEVLKDIEHPSRPKLREVIREFIKGIRVNKADRKITITFDIGNDTEVIYRAGEEKPEIEEVISSRYEARGIEYVTRVGRIRNIKKKQERYFYEEIEGQKMEGFSAFLLSQSFKSAQELMRLNGYPDIDPMLLWSKK